MKDRIAKYPGRVRLTPVNGQTNVYDMTRLDDPTQVGDPLNKNTLLKDATAALFGLGANAVPDEVLARIANERIPVVDATNSSDDMDVYAAQGAHLKWYRTGQYTQHTPYAAGATSMYNGLILSFASSTGACIQVSFTSGSYLMFVRRLYGTGTEPSKWEKLYTGHTKPTASDLGVYSLSDLGEQIPEGADLNTYVTPGRYRVTSGAAAQKLVTTSLPFDVLSLSYSGFTLIVERGYSSTSHVIQTLIASDHKVCMREKFDGVWDSWALNYTTLQNPKAADVGAVSLDGSNAMTGDLQIKKASPRVLLTNTSTGVEVRVSNVDKAAVLQATESVSASSFRQLRLLSTGHSTAPAGSLKDVLQIYTTVSGEKTQSILHTGNISEHGVAKIETGSYVGTGYNGEANANSLSFSFAPKVLMIFTSKGIVHHNGLYNSYGTVLAGGNVAIGYPAALTTSYQADSLFEYYYGNGGGDMYAKKSDDGKTISWYNSYRYYSDEQEEYIYAYGERQLNAANTTYYYVAIG
jgi:hypothetical protein